MPALLTRRLVADGISPVSLFAHLMQQQRYAFLLESVTGGDKRGRYSIIALDPDLIWRCKDGAAEIETADSSVTPCAEKPLKALEKLIDDCRMELPPELPSMASGLIGLMGYEMVREAEHLPSTKEGPHGLPDGCFMRPRLTLVHDNVNDCLTLVSPVWDDSPAAHIAAQQRLDAAVQQLQNLPPLPPVEVGKDLPEVAFTANMTQADFLHTVERAKEYIRAGDIFQIVPSMRFTAANYTPSPIAFYRALRNLNPSPYMFCLKLDGAAIIGASPEILVRLRGQEVTLRPIAGTRKRGANEAEDTALAAELLADEKELAEHLMLLDLGRNDVGRVSKGGSVQVTEQMIIERYSHVMHIVSNVTGSIAPHKTALDALMAGFPAGTVTGAPKIRAMQILDELEPQRRGFYGGCVGYFSANGDMDSCITLRTALMKDGKLHLQAGAGVVADSVPQSEYEEIHNKAKALMRAAQLAPLFEVTEVKE